MQESLLLLAIWGIDDARYNICGIGSYVTMGIMNLNLMLEYDLTYDGYEPLRNVEWMGSHLDTEWRVALLLSNSRRQARM